MKKKRTMRTAKKILIFHIALVFVILGALYAAINSSWLHRYAASIVEQRTGWSISVDNLRIYPFLGAVSVRNAHVQDPTKRQLYDVGWLYARINPLSLFRGKIILARLELSDAFLSFDRGPEAVPEGPPKFTIDYIRDLSAKIAHSFALQNISVQDGKLRNIKILIQKRAGGYTDLSIGNFEFALEQSLWRRLNLNFVAEDFLINQNIVASKLTVDAELAADQVIFKQLLYERPEGTYEATLDAHIEKKSVDGDIKVGATIPAAFKKKIEGEGRLRLTPPNLYLDPFTIKAGSLSLHPTARMNARSGHYQIDLSVPPTHLADVWAVFKLPTLEKLSGDVSLQGQLKETLPHFGATAQLTGQSLVYDNLVTLPQVSATVDIKGNDASWQAMAPQLTTTGRVTFIHGKGLEVRELSVNADNLAMEKAVVGDKVAGDLTGQFQIQQEPKGYLGTGRFAVKDGRLGTTELESAALAFTWEGPTIQVNEFSVNTPIMPAIAFTGPLRIKLADKAIEFTGQPLEGLDIKARYLKDARQFTADTIKYEKSGEVLTAEGYYRLDQNFRARLKGSFDAALLGSFRKVFNEASGVVDVDLTGSGAIKQPQLTGYVQARRVTMDLRGLSDPITDFNGKLSIASNHVTLENFQGNYGDGNFIVTGKLALANFIPQSYDVRLKGDGLGYRIPGTLQFDFDTDLTVTGTMPSPLVSGKIDLISGRYYKNFNIAKKVFEERGVKVIKERQTDYFDQWRWDLKIRNSGDLNIKNNLADVYLDGDLRLKGTTLHPVLEGVVTTTEGELYYLGQKMEIVEGTLEFKDPNRINPVIDFEASKDIAAQGSRGLRSSYTVSVNVEGPLDNLQVKLSSSPSVDQTDIVSLLAFGMTQSQLREQGSSGSALASTAIASSLASGFGSSLGETLGFDTLRFESGGGSDQAISGVEVGKELSDRLTIEFYTDIAPQDAQRRIRGRYFLTDNIFLEGTNTVGGDQTIFDLNASVRFKIR